LPSGVAPLAVHDTGSGPAVLFLHAFPLDGSQWDHQVAALSGDYRCLRPDVWGCGGSPPPPDAAATLDDFAQAVITALDDRGIDRFSVVGMSMGGYVAFALWRLAPARVVSLTVSNTRADADSDETRAGRLEVAERVLREGDVAFLVEANVDRLLGPKARLEVHITDPLRGRIKRCTPAGIAFAQRAMAARPDSAGLLHGITVPTLVVTGRDDAVIPEAQMQTIADGIPQALRVDLDCGHLSNLEQPQEFTRALSDFLSALPRT
jgi:pimeloyl-ACP methyl ester carboxylesterase